MRRILILCTILFFCTTTVTPALDVTLNGMDTSQDSTGPYIIRHYDYVLDGRQGIVPLALSTKLYEMYLEKKPNGYSDNESYFLTYLNDRDQNRYFEALGDEIRKKTDNPDDQARIAISLVQHLPYLQESPHRYPYEVLYDSSGVCCEKSILLVALLRELGFKSSVMYFIPENHMAVGISCPEPYDFKGSGYCLVQTTNAVIVTDDSRFRNYGENWSSPEIIQTSDGRSFESVISEYSDARTWIHLQSASKTARESGTMLSRADNIRWYQLQKKYDLN
ncbi:MAG: transglutaminase-like domain-containing protein [Methanoregula sp.]|nr:transglutaminase-like domain-containing protein [Methanoregula sp.]